MIFYNEVDKLDLKVNNCVNSLKHICRTEIKFCPCSYEALQPQSRYLRDDHGAPVCVCVCVYTVVPLRYYHHYYYTLVRCCVLTVQHQWWDFFNIFPPVLGPAMVVKRIKHALIALIC